ncbi:MAG: cell division protein SepF [Lachnospiraceae bacterium]|nr:cell division protein SepF [Lachnospiraceae bacterium]
MGFLDFFKIKDLDDDDEFEDDLFDEDDDDDEYTRQKKAAKRNAAKAVDSSASAAPASKPFTSSTSMPSRSSYSAQPQQSAGSYQPKPSYSQQPASQPEKRTYTSASNKLVDINSRPRRTVQPAGEVYVIRPADLGDAQTVADFLNNGMTIVINMEGMELSLAQRVIDIVYGASYAMGGSLSPISNNIFIAAPNTIEVTGDLRDEILSEAVSPSLG